MRQTTLRPTSPLALELYGPPNGTFISWQGCRDTCSRTPGCASFRFLTATGACQQYRNEPNVTNLLVPCGDGCVFGYRMPSWCGRTVSASIA